MIDFFHGLWQFELEAHPPKPRFAPDDIPDLSGKIAIVTGANSGVGKEVAKELLRKNAKVYVACRNRASTEAAIAELKQETGNEAAFLELDLADLKKIKKAVDTFTSSEKELHILVNNAGVMWTPVEMLTADGYDLQFGTNVLGPFYFTKFLIPTLVETAKNAPERQVRIVSEASIMRHYVHKIKFDTLRAGKPRNRAGSNELYCQSKFGVAVMAKEFARRYADNGIVSIGCAPGIIKTNLLRHTNFLLSFLIDKIYMFKPYYGMLTPLFGAASPDAKDLNGAFLLPWARVGRAGRGMDDAKIGEELWNWLEEQVKAVEQ